MTVTAFRTGIWRRLREDSQGVLLIEVLIGLAILGLISVVFIGGLYTSLQAARVADESSTSLTLAKSQIEYVRDRDYQESDDWEADDDWEYSLSTTDRSASDPPPWWAAAPPSFLEAEYQGYSVTVAGTSDVDVDGNGSPDLGIRVITATVYHQGGEVFSLSNYEVDR